MRPSIHFAPESGWINDPNGLIWRQGRWLAFHQRIPPGGTGLHWGLATSDDLLNWEDHGPVIFPTELGEIWSGSAVEHSGRLGAFFTLRQANPERQSQGAAWSSDGGMTWEMDPGNPLLTSSKSDFRDPKVFWHEESSRWVMVVAAGQEAEVYASSDLCSWQLTSKLRLEVTGDLIWECPDLLSLKDEEGRQVWVLTMSFVNPTRSGDRPWGNRSFWIAGSFDGAAFDPVGALTPLTGGPDDYAAISFAQAPNGRTVLLGWLNSWELGPAISPLPWQGQLTCPRELAWERGRLLQRPVREWSQVPLWDATIDSPAWRLELPPGDFRVEILKGGESAATLHRSGETLVLERRRSSMPSWREPRPDLEEVFLTPVKLQSRGIGGWLFVDQFSFEAFLDDGESLLIAQAYPPQGPWTLSLSWEALPLG
jgi:fructan beta-fructosidase